MNEDPVTNATAIFIGYKKMQIKNKDTKEMENFLEVKLHVNPLEDGKLKDLPLGQILNLYLTKTNENT